MHETASASLSAFDMAAILVVASALLGWFNHHFLKLPHVIGLTVMGALGAIGLMVANTVIPGITLDDTVARLLQQLNFTDTLLQGMLSFLLFAGALHVDLERLRSAWLPVLLLSTVGVIVSTVLVGLAVWGVGLLLGLSIAPIWYFVFGALIAPTDPVSVLGVLKEENVPLSLQSAVAGESLFNDGVGIVVFTILLGAAVTGADFSLSEGARLFAIEAGGGVLVGLAAGYVGYRALAGMDEYAIEVLITLAVVMGGYALCSALHISGPLAMAVAGLQRGHHGDRRHSPDAGGTGRGGRQLDQAHPRCPPSATGCGAGAVVGRPARRHLDRARPVAARRAGARSRPCRHLRRGALQRARPARDARSADRASQGPASRSGGRDGRKPNCARALIASTCRLM